MLFLSTEARRTMRERRKEKQRMLDLGPLIPINSETVVLYSRPRRNTIGNTIMTGNFSIERRILQVSDKTFLTNFFWEIIPSNQLFFYLVTSTFFWSEF